MKYFGDELEMCIKGDTNLKMVDFGDREKLVVSLGGNVGGYKLLSELSVGQTTMGDKVILVKYSSGSPVSDKSVELPIAMTYSLDQSGLESAKVQLENMHRLVSIMELSLKGGELDD